MVHLPKVSVVSVDALQVGLDRRVNLRRSGSQCFGENQPGRGDDHDEIAVGHLLLPRVQEHLAELTSV